MMVAEVEDDEGVTKTNSNWLLSLMWVFCCQEYVDWVNLLWTTT